ncbi:MAG: HRDC domain-containing protein [Acidobacteriota bacterium]
MCTSPLPAPVVVDDEDGLDRLCQALAPHPVVAVDTESNSLHAYRECVCLIQFSTPDTDYIVDPLGLPDLNPLAPFFANSSQQKIFHAAEYDLICLRRDYHFDIANIFDTMSAARTLGWPQVGLAAILDTHFGVKLNKKYQRADWKRRPLKPEQLDYARLDTHYLVALRDLQIQLLKEAGHWPEAQEDFARLVRQRPGSDRPDPNPLAFWRVKGARDLSPAQAAVLQALFGYREEQAARMDRPPFKVMGEAVLMELVRRAPTRIEELKRLPGLTPKLMHRHGRGLLRAMEKGLHGPTPRAPQALRESDDVRDRYDLLHAWRKKRARARGVESDVILPRTVLRDLARSRPLTHGELEEIADFGPWRRKAYGAEILVLLSGATPSPDSP